VADTPKIQSIDKAKTKCMNMNFIKHDSFYNSQSEETDRKTLLQLHDIVKISNQKNNNKDKELGSATRTHLRFGLQDELGTQEGKHNAYL
jgi:hypothetical protein